MLRCGRAAAVLAGSLPPLAAAAQQPGFSGYYLNVFTRVGESVVLSGGVSDLQRLRVMWNGPWGRLGADLAYEQTLSLRQDDAPGASLFTASGLAAGGDWVSLDGELHDGRRALWRHRIDRLNLRIDLGGNADLVVGRQPVSWATTLFLTPADPFSPFDPADPFREYRIGVDAARLRYYRGAFTQFELVARPARIGDRETLTLLGRVGTNRSGWDLGAWGGSVHGTFGAAAFLSGAVGLWALRAEAAVRDVGDEAVVRGTVGLDRTFAVAGRDLYLVIEVQRDGLGATSPRGLLTARANQAYLQGEMQVLGREVGAVQLSYTLHPLVTANVLVVGNLRDRSLLVSPVLGWSSSESVSLRVGGYLGVGDGLGRLGPAYVPRSEFGSLPSVVFGSLNWFF